MESIKTINPANGEELASYSEFSDSQVENALAKAQDAYAFWRKRSFEERAEMLRAAAKTLVDSRDDSAKLITSEMGKPISQSRAEVEKCGSVLEYYAKHGADHLADENPVDRPNERDFVAYQPLGPILAIMPWNFPYWQVFRAAAPALMAGNTMLLKHAANVTGCSLRIEKLLLEAGLPEGVFQSLPISAKRVSSVIENRAIRGVTLTGSEGAGRKVAEAAGRSLKPSVLELGGSDAYLVLHDADLDKAAELCAKSRLTNTGQSCIAAKRFIVVSEVYEEFSDKFTEAMKAAKQGDPMDDSVELGPLAREDLRDDLHEQTRSSIESGAKLLLGGEVPEQPGWFYPATVLEDVQPEMTAYCEELFGPVASLIKAKDEQDAIRIANDSTFGLGGGVFTKDRERGIAVARQMETGAVFINDFVKSHPALPFGGVKDSGYGRELGQPGIRAFINAKTISVP